MQFNPLFIQPVNTAEKSAKAVKGGVQKQMNLNNSSYLFSDIIRIVNENLPDEKQTALNNVNENTPGYLSVEDNFKYRMFITLAENAHGNEGIQVNNFNKNNIQYPVTFSQDADTNELKAAQTITQKENVSISSVNNAGIESIINQLAAMFAKLGIKPESIELNKSVTTQANSGEVKHLIQKIDQTINSNKSNHQINNNKSDKKSAKNSEAIQNLTNLLSGMLQSNNVIHLDLTANGNTFNLEITNAKAGATNPSGDKSITNSPNAGNESVDTANNTDLPFPEVKEKAESINSTSTGQVKNKINEVPTTENYPEFDQVKDAAGVTIKQTAESKAASGQDSNLGLIANPVPIEMPSEESGLKGNYTGSPAANFNIKEFVNQDLTDKTQIKLPASKINNQMSFPSSNEKIQLSKKPAVETVKDIQTFETGKSDIKPTADKFFITVSKPVQDDKITTASISNNNFHDLKKFITENSDGDIKLKLEITNPIKQNTVKTSPRQIKTDNLAFNKTTKEDLPAADTFPKISKSESSEEIKQVPLNLNHSSETIDEGRNVNSKAEVNSVSNQNTEAASIGKSTGEHSSNAFDDTQNKPSDNSNKGAQVKKSDLSFTIMNHNSSTETANPVKEMAFNKNVRSELPKTYKLSEAINEIKNLMAKGDTKSAVLQLKPESLGKVKVTLDVTSNSVHARVEVDNESVKQVVQNNVNDLKQSLSQNGMQLNSFTVNLSSSEQKQSRFFSPNKKLNYQNIKVQEEDNQESYSSKNLGYNTYEYLA